MKVAAFDFDHTLIDVNSDTYIDKLIVSIAQTTGKRSKYYSYSEEIENLTESHGWTHRMNAVFRYMHEKYKISQEKLLNCMREIELSAEMKSLLRILKQTHGFELYILSDSNTVFIETILEANGLLPLFDLKKNVITNRGFFDSNGCLVAVPLNQDYNENGAPFDCSTKICKANICKGQILRDLVKSLGGRPTSGAFNSGSDSVDPSYSNQIWYFGDGTNDYCPGLQLGLNDCFFIRNGFSLVKLLTKNPELESKIIAKKTYWNDAKDILGNVNL